MKINLFDLIIMIHNLCVNYNWDEYNIYLYANDHRLIYKISYPSLIRIGIMAKSYYNSEEVNVKYAIYDYPTRVIMDKVSYSLNGLIENIITIYKSMSSLIFLPLIIELTNPTFNSRINLSYYESYNSYKEFMNDYVTYK